MPSIAFGHIPRELNKGAHNFAELNYDFVGDFEQFEDEAEWLSGVNLIL